MQNILITGGAGFIGSNLAAALIERGCQVCCVDNFVLGTRENVAHLTQHDNFYLYEFDVNDTERIKNIMSRHQIDMVYHLAANSDIQKSAKIPDIDLSNTFLTTASVLEAMRANDIRKMFFASTSAVYGEKTGILLRENIGDLAPISYYGGAKLASEAMISAYAYMNDLSVTVFRFANVIGPGLTHGVIYDFVKKLNADSQTLQILGDGKQRKPYIHVSDLIDAILRLTEEPLAGVNIYNVGVDSDTTVTEIADMVCDALKLTNARYQYTGGDRGWKGDVPAFSYDLTKIHATGWKAKYTSNEAVQKTITEFTEK